MAPLIISQMEIGSKLTIQDMYTVKLSFALCNHLQAWSVNMRMMTLPRLQDDGYVEQAPAQCRALGVPDLPDGLAAVAGRLPGVSPPSTKSQRMGSCE